MSSSVEGQHDAGCDESTDKSTDDVASETEDVGHWEDIQKVAAEFREKYVDDINHDDDDETMEMAVVENGNGDEDSDEEKKIENWEDLANEEKKRLLKTHALAIRCHVASYMFQREKISIRNKIEHENNKDYQNRLHEFKVSKTAKAAACEDDGPELKRLRRKNAVSVSQTWAQNMSDTTGLSVTVVLGGTPLGPGETFQIDSVHAGMNKDGKT
ncbi:hypothetical protein MPER_04367, partial [Moniliophthora perniciosa FA553]